MLQFTIRDILVLFVLVPLTIGIAKYKTTDYLGRLFIFFLLVGLTTDLTMGILLHSNKTRHLMRIFNTYSLIESFFFLWFIMQTALSRSIYLVSRFCLITVVLLWICYMFIFPNIDFLKSSLIVSFDATYEIVVSFLAGYALLLRVEKDQFIFSEPRFWFTLGIFFYCFCTFYIMTFLETNLLQKIWFVINIINIISYVFYSVGFWNISRSQKAL